MKEKNFTTGIPLSGKVPILAEPAPETSISFPLRLPAEMLEFIDDECDRLVITRSEYLEKLLYEDGDD